MLRRIQGYRCVKNTLGGDAKFVCTGHFNLGAEHLYCTELRLAMSNLAGTLDAVVGKTV